MYLCYKTTALLYFESDYIYNIPRRPLMSICTYIQYARFYFCISVNHNISFFQELVVVVCSVALSQSSGQVESAVKVLLLFKSIGLSF